MLADDIRGGESSTLEFKRAIPDDPVKYLKTVCAFANGKGGRIIFGVDTDLRIIGMADIFTARDRISDAIANGIEPIIVPDISVQTVEDKSLIVVEIAQGPICPYWVKSIGRENGTFIRYDATTRSGDDQIIAELSYDGSNRGFDAAQCRTLELTPRKMHALCRRLRAKALESCETAVQRRAVHSVTEEKLEEWGVLTRRGGCLVATNAFALLSGDKALSTLVRCGVFRGTGHRKMLDRREFGGPVQDQIAAAYDWVLAKINMAAVVKGVYRHDVYEFPEGALRELITNAVMHRSYAAYGSDIQIALYDDRLEIISPGGLPRGVTIERMKSGCSRCRNKAIAEAFAYMHIAEKWGLGVPNAVQDFLDYGLGEPEYTDWGNAIRVVVRRTVMSKVESSKHDNEPKKLVLEDEKLVFSPEKLVLRDGMLVVGDKNLDMAWCSAPTRARILALYKSFGDKEYFRRSDVVSSLGMARSTVGNLIESLLKHDCLESVSGHGKGAYRLRMPT